MTSRAAFGAIALFTLAVGACAHRISEPEPVPADQSAFRAAELTGDETGLPEEFHGAAIGGDALRGALQSE